MWTPEQKAEKRDHALQTMAKRYGGDPSIVEAATSEQSMAEDFARQLGLDLIYVEGLPEGESSRIHGTTISRDGRVTGVIAINTKQKDADQLWTIVGHEIAHGTTLDRMAPFLEISEAEIDRIWAEKMEGQSPEFVAKYERLSEQDKELRRREAVAHYVEALFQDANFRRRVVESQPGIVRKVLNFFNVFNPKMTRKQRNVVNALRLLMNKTYGATKRPKTYNEIYDELSELSNKEISEKASELVLPVIGKRRWIVLSELSEEILSNELAALHASTISQADENAQNRSKEIPDQQKQALIEQSERGAADVIDRLRRNGVISLEDAPTPTEAPIVGRPADDVMSFEEETSTQNTKQLLYAAKELASYVMIRVKTGESLEDAVTNTLSKAGFTTQLPPDASPADKARQRAAFRLRKLVTEEVKWAHKAMDEVLGDPTELLPFNIQYAATNKMMHLLRDQLNLSPSGAPSSLQLESMAKKAIGEMQNVQAYTTAVYELASAIKLSPRVLTADEQIAFFFSLNWFAHQLRVKSKQLRIAEEKGGRKETMEALVGEITSLREKLDITSDANRLAGSAWSITGRIRGALGRQHLHIGYEVDDLLTEARSRKDTELTPAEISFIKKLAKQHKDLESRIESMQGPVMDRQASDAIRSKRLQKATDNQKIGELQDRLKQLAEEFNC